MPADWVIAVISNSWTTNKRELNWIKYFNQYTKSCTKDRYWLLIINRYKSHHLYEFEKYYKDWNIILFCISVHSFYKLQLFDVKCFSSLKCIYGTEIEKLIYIYIIYISKEDFFSTFVITFCTAITESNV